MVSMFVSSADNRGFERRSCQTKDYYIGFSFFSAAQSAIRKKDWLARNWDNMSG